MGGGRGGGVGLYKWVFETVGPTLTAFFELLFHC